MIDGMKLVLLLLCSLILQSLRAEVPAVDPWSAEVAKVGARVKKAVPPIGGTFFVGSSSIRMWKLDKSFPEMHATNVGFGGSKIADCTRFAPRLILPWKPARIVFYAGSNDLAAERTPQQVVADFREFEELIHTSLPECQIVFLAINPNTARWKLWEQMQEANRLISTFCKTTGESRLRFIDVGRIFLGADGLPRPELFLDDKLHLNEAGYAVWVEKLGPMLRTK
jgi:lysophospholipase L1-like esterase